MATATRIEDTENPTAFTVPHPYVPTEFGHCGYCFDPSWVSCQHCGEPGEDDHGKPTPNHVLSQVLPKVGG